MKTYNAALAAIEMPDRVKSLPVSPEGFPVPWFVAWMKGGAEVAPSEPGAEADFRVIGRGNIEAAVTMRRCWICGQPTGRFLCFVIGPMCSVNRVTSEPPNHVECARFAARACPFLTRPRMRRNVKDMPAGAVQDRGIHIDRNPGATCLWVVDKPYGRESDLHRGKAGFAYMPVNGLFRLGEPAFVDWYAEGKTATRAQIEASIYSGEPFLRETCDREVTAARRAAAHVELNKQLDKVQRLLPAMEVA